MPTGTLGTAARFNPIQLVHYCRVKIPGGGAAGNQTVNISALLPNGANVLRISTMIRTVFSGGTPTISFGTAASPAAFFAAAGGPITTAGRNAVTLIATGTLSMTADTQLVGVIGGVPTAGDGDIEVEFTVNNDQ
jgi:hypothetical protein